MSMTVWDAQTALNSVGTSILDGNGIVLTQVTMPEDPSYRSFLPLQEVPTTHVGVLAQQFDQDILGDLANAWNIFIQSGQVWALVVGLVLGYLIRGLTTY